MNSTLAAFFGWLLRASWQASILVLVVLIVQRIFRRRLSPQWRHALWLLVLVRLVLPSVPSSPTSLYNCAWLATPQMHSMPPALAPKVLPAPVSPVALHETPSATYENAVILTQPAPSADVRTGMAIGKSAPAMAIQAPASSTPNWRHDLPNIFAIVWLAGAILTACRVLVQNILFLRRLRMAKEVTAPEILSIFERCRQQLAVRTKIVLVETTQVRSPALYGLLRPKLLLPSEMMDHFETDELRHIFLHELAHVKRRDAAVSWWVALGGIFHWFNPVLRFGFRRMAGDREMACDEIVLTQVGQRESARYGEMILKLLDFCSHPPAVPGLVGILGNQSPLKQRIAMIASFGQRRHRPALAVVLLVAITLVTLTDAKTQPPNGSDGLVSWSDPGTNNFSQLSPGALTQKGLAEEKTQHNLTNALEAFRAAVATYDHDRQQVAVAVFQQGEILRQIGKFDQANEQYRRILRDFPDQKEFAALSRKYLLNLTIAPPTFVLSINDVLYPGGVAVDSDGDIYVSDTRRDSVEKFDGNGTLLSQFGGSGSGPGLLSYPQGLAVGPGDCLYVADVQNQRVQKFGSDGKFLVAWGEEGTGTGMFNRPYNVAVDKKGDVYVVNSENNRIQKFTGDGTFIKEFGPVGGDGRQLKSPQGVAVDGEGNVYVGDGSNGRIVKYTADGAYLMAWESPPDPDNPGASGAMMNGHPFVQGGYIHDVAADAQGHVYAVSAGTECVQMFSSQGTLLSQWGSKGTGPGQFDFVARVAVDPAGKRVFVTDAHNNRAQVFAFLPRTASK